MTSLRLTELKLPLDHTPEALRSAVLVRLLLQDAQLASLSIYRRGYDARKKAAIVFVYTVDVTLAGYAGEGESAACGARARYVVQIRHPHENRTENPPSGDWHWAVWPVRRAHARANGLLPAGA